MGFLRQTWALTTKDLRIVVLRRWFSTFLRAVALPIAYMFFIAYVRNFFLPPSDYGIGSPRPVRNLTSEVFGSDVSLGGRDRVVFINSGNTGGQIDQLIDNVAAPLREAGADVYTLSSDDELLEICRSNLRGLSRCYAAATFHSSPAEGGIWSYTVRTDFGLGLSVYVDRANNDAQRYVLPFVHAIDSEIARLNDVVMPEVMLEYPFTRETTEERDDRIQSAFTGALSRYLGVALFIGICGVAYHLPGFIATEREHGISALIDAMLPSNGPWKAVIARLTSAYISFVAVYLPGWIGMGAIVSVLIYYHTATSIVVLFHILTGLALTAFSILGGSFFRKAQLSGITVLILSLVTAVLIQFIPRMTTTVAVLSVLFPSITYTSFIIYLSEWEETLTAANLMETSPGSRTDLPGYTYFVFLAIQIVVFPILSVVLQRVLHGSSQASRRFIPSLSGAAAFRIVGVSKHYYPSRPRQLLSRLGIFKRDPFKAVDDITLSALPGTILTLLGANGAGKSTTMSMMAGTTSTTHGYIEIASGTSLGVCPQHNVLWPDLTVLEHVKIFNGLKAIGECDSKAAMTELISACDLEHKMNAKSKTLSGGQKRKLQLAMAFTAGSRLCMIDEVSSGLDPLSRRIIWRILLAERGRRTILMTTHALDEADALSDQIAIMSKGKVIAEGSAVELKHKFGNGYKMVVEEDSTSRGPTPSTPKKERLYHVKDSSEASELAISLQKEGNVKVDISGPTIEDVFLATAEEFKDEHNDHTPNRSDTDVPDDYLFDKDGQDYGLAQGRGTGFISQVWILYRKRLLILTRNYLPYFFAIVIPVLTAGLATMFLGGFDRLICSPDQLANNPRTASLPILEIYWGIDIPAGPSDRLSISSLPAAYAPYADRFRPVNTFNEFQSYIQNNYRDVMPGGVYLGDNATAPPLLAYRIDGSLSYAAIAKNLIDSLVLNTTILFEYSTFALPIAGSTGDSLQLVMYFGFAMCAYPAFFALYPTFERIGNIRALHYSNGVRPAALWLAYTLYDTGFVILISVLAIVVLTSVSDQLSGMRVYANIPVACWCLVRPRILFCRCPLIRYLVYVTLLHHIVVYNNPARNVCIRRRRSSDLLARVFHPVSPFKLSSNINAC
jgi:ATP-binding cassette, subfamily A (ABC1), member 3